jgi:charged multivesicular body protein 4
MSFCALLDLTAAIQCLKKKKLYETQVEQLGNFQLRIHDQV